MLPPFVIQPLGAGAVSSLAVNFGGGPAAGAFCAAPLAAGSTTQSAARDASGFGEVCMMFVGPPIRYAILARGLALLPLELARVTLEPLADDSDEVNCRFQLVVAEAVQQRSQPNLLGDPRGR